MKILFVFSLFLFFSPFRASDQLAPAKIELARKKASSTVRFIIGTTYLNLSPNDTSEETVNLILQALLKVIKVSKEESERLKEGIETALKISIFKAENYTRTQIKNYNDLLKGPSHKSTEHQ